MEDPLMQKFQGLGRLIGNTPLLEIDFTCNGKSGSIFAKFESLNMTGSIKDRMALHIIRLGYERSVLQPGAPLVEATSGNTGISFAAVGRALGHDVRIYMPDWMSRERVLVIESLGAQIVPVSAEEGGFKGSIAQVEAYAAEHEGVFMPRQFESPANVEAHFQTTGPELLGQLAAQGLEPTGFVAGVGTGGTVMGVGRYLREHVPGVTAHPLEPANSPTLRTGHRVGKHRIQGISDEFIPAIVDLSSLDEVVDAWDGDSILMAQKLASRLGLGVGISSGANFLGAVQIALEQGEGAVVATVFPDSNKKYLSTDLCCEEPVLDKYLSPEIELLGCRVVPSASRSPVG
ncbi:MAG: PLP-dependent cysteine synthase family protein [Gammaproteobacteria bacterium]|nr:PLP-dependent cysteine synthase family protein [Gammaproteobacteria bacterium]